MFLLGLVTH